MKLTYPVSKSHMAFLFNVQTMFEKWGKVYMWTFTFEKFQPDWRAMMRWDDLKKKLVGTGASSGTGLCPLLVGLRVVEVHPGNNFHRLSHGLHFHCLFNERVNIHKLMRIARPLGFGQVRVRRVTEAEAQYVGKYITKKDDNLSKGTRRWGTINWPAADKVRDIKIESQFHTSKPSVPSESLSSALYAADVAT